MKMTTIVVEEDGKKKYKRVPLEQTPDEAAADEASFSVRGVAGKLKGGSFTSYGDHRIAMAFAPLRLAFPDLKIESPEVVDKSFPEFWDEFDKVLNA